MNNKKLWYPAAMVIALSVAFGAAEAKPLEQVGTAENRAEPLKTYGVDVSTKAGLKTLLPTGWNLFIYKNTSLPQSISWTVGDTWIVALEKFADKNELAVRLDWNKKAVYVSTPEVAIEARAKLAEISNAARTPLPQYQPATAITKNETKTAAALVEKPVETKIAVAEVSAPAPQPKIAVVTPKPAEPAQSVTAHRPIDSDLLARALAATAPVKPATAPAAVAPAASSMLVSPAVAQAASPTAPFSEMRSVAAAAPALIQLTPPVGPIAAGAAPLKPLSSPIAPMMPPVMSPVMSQVMQSVAVVQASAATPTSNSDAFARGNLEDIVRKTAAKLGYQVSWETVSLPLTGPVTFLGMDAAEDMRLLQKSLGMKQTPIAIEVYRGSNVIRVTASSPGREPLAVYDSTYSGMLGYGEKTAASRAPDYSAPSAAVASFKGLPSSGPVIPALPPVTVAAAPTQALAPAIEPVQATQVPAVQPASTQIALHVAKGESLSKALAQFLKGQGWELKWHVSGDMEAEFPFDAEGTSIKQVLNGLLPKLGLDTDMYAPSKMVVVRPIDNTVE